MSKKCELTGKIPMKGHNVSHANNKTKRRFLPNLKKVKFTSELMKRSLKLTVSNAGVRSVDKKGSFDEYLKTVKNKNVSIVDPIKDDVKGAINHFFFLNWSNICTSNSWATKKAVPEPIAILTEIRSAKFVENIRVKLIPIAKPI